MPAQVAPPELTPIPPHIEARVRSFVETAPTLQTGKFLVDLTLVLGILALVGTPIVFWLLLWLGGEFDFFPSLFGGVCVGLFVGCVVAVILGVIYRTGGQMWKYRCVLAAENLFRETFPPQSTDFPLAVRSLLEQENADETGVSLAVAESVQFSRRGGAPAAASFHVPAAAIEEMKRLAADMQPYLNLMFATESFQLGFDSGDPAFDAGKLPLPPGEAAICTIDLHSWRNGGEESAYAAAVVTPTRLIICRNWSDSPVVWTEVPYDRLLRIDSSRSTRLVFHCLEETVVVWPMIFPDYYGAFLSCIVQAARSPSFHPAPHTLDLEAVKQGLLKGHERLGEAVSAKVAADLIAQGRVRCPGCRSAKVVFIQGLGWGQRQALSLAGVAAGSLVFGPVGGFVGSGLGQTEVDRFRCEECKQEFPFGSAEGWPAPAEPAGKDRPSV